MFKTSLLSVNSMQSGVVRVTGKIINGSTATGLLIIIYSLTNDSDHMYTTSQQPRNVHATSPKLVAVETSKIIRSSYLMTSLMYRAIYLKTFR